MYMCVFSKIGYTLYKGVRVIMAKAITAWIVGYVELHEIITYVAY